MTDDAAAVLEPAAEEHRAPEAETASAVAQRPTYTIVTDTGRALTREGQHELLTKVFRNVMGNGSRKVRAERRRFLRWFLCFQVTPGENGLTFLSDDFEDAMMRIEEALVDAGLNVTSENNDLLLGSCWVMQTEGSRSINYLAGYVSVIRELYRQLAKHKLRPKANPADVDNWHTMSPAKRLDFAKRLYPKNRWAWKHAGGRFVVRGRSSSPPALEDSLGCAERMMDALGKANVPIEVEDVSLVTKANGCRITEAADLNGLGFAMKGFGDQCMARSKAKGPDPVKPLTLPAPVRSRVIERLTSTPHPEDANRTMLDYLKERWAAQDLPALRAVPLIPSAKTGRSYSYAGLHYHLSDAWNGRVFVHSESGIRQVTSQWFRHAAITYDTRKLFMKTADREARKEGLFSIMDRFFLSSDQTGRYAGVEYEREQEEERRNAVREREQAGLAHRGVAPTPTRVNVAFSSAATEEAWQMVPKRNSA